MKAIAVAGLGFGDEGKGTTVDALVEKLGAGLVVRYNGGAQAAHNVIRGKDHHCFAQFGAGTLAGARTHLSRFMIVNPPAFFNEARHLELSCGVQYPHQLVTASPNALVTTPYHIYANRLREALRGKDAHGTTGMGVGETYELDRDHEDLTLRVEDLYSFDRRTKLEAIREHYLDWISTEKIKHEGTYFFDRRDVFEDAIDSYRQWAERIVLKDDAELEKMMRRAKVTIFEGAQGMLLDQIFGFHPYSTWSDCTFDQVLDLIDDFDVELTRLGVLRSYHTRHGAGPLPTEKESFHKITFEDHNAKGLGYQGVFRAGPFDLVLARYAVRTIGRVDGLVMTHLDKLPKDDFASYAKSYFHEGTEHSYSDLKMDPDKIARFIYHVDPRFANVGTREFPEHIASELGVPLVMTSNGPRAEDKQFYLESVDHDE